MSTTYQGNAANYPALITIPSDGDDISAASVNAALEGLADRTNYLFAGGAGQVYVPAGQGSVQQRTALDTPLLFAGSYRYPTPNAADGIVLALTGFQISQVTTGANVAWGFRVPLSHYMPHGARLTSAAARIRPAAGHAGLPGLMPTWGIARTTREDSAASLLSTGSPMGTVVDTSASVTAYETDHDIVLTPDQNNIIDRTQYSYMAVFYGEGGTNALANLALYGFKLSFSPT